MNCAKFRGCLSHVPRAVQNSEKGEKRKIRTSPMYIILYTPSTDHIQYCNMSYSEGNCGNFSVGNELTVARTETPSLTEMRALPLNRGLLCRTAHESYVQSHRRSKVCSIWIFFVPFDADDICTDRIEAESRQKQLLHKLAIRIAPLGTNGGSSRQQINLTIMFGRHLLYMRARSCRFICKAVVEIGWSCC